MIRVSLGGTAANATTRSYQVDKTGGTRGAGEVDEAPALDSKSDGLHGCGLLAMAPAVCYANRPALSISRSRAGNVTAMAGVATTTSLIYRRGRTLGMM